MLKKGMEKSKISIVLFILLLGLFFARFLSNNPAENNIRWIQLKGSEDLFLGPAQRFTLESPDFVLVQKNSLKASLPPTIFSSQVLGALVGDFEVSDTRRAIVEYIVESGDNLSSIAIHFNISLESLLWANNLNQKSVIQSGQKLIIPPVSGVIYHVKSGDTISGIAQTYKGKIEEIVAFNQLSSEDDIFIGDIIIIPEGKMPPPPAQVQLAPSAVPLASSYFIVPVSSPHIITQRLHWYNAIDFSHEGNACGKPVFAAAGGTVQRTGFDRLAGNYVRILHPNGVVTFYGHLSSIFVSSGQSVLPGTTIGLMGNTGRTVGPTGCHLHFEIRGARNPFGG